MTKIQYKPLSVNEVWQGKRFKTKAYQEYERDLMYLLPKIEMPLPPYLIEMEFGMSALSDIDNPVKPFLDILQKKYGINDRYINTLIVRKKQVKKGLEFITFKIENEKAH